jgi:hypothetical protein
LTHPFKLEELANLLVKTGDVLVILTMEYESRWMMHALKCGWPIDNFELLKLGEDGLGGINRQAQLTEIVQGFDPLTAPFEVIQPLLRKYFTNTADAAIANWYCSHYVRGAYPDEQGILQRLALLERLHGLKR